MVGVDVPSAMSASEVNTKVAEAVAANEAGNFDTALNQAGTLARISATATGATGFSDRRPLLIDQRLAYGLTHLFCR